MYISKIAIKNFRNFKDQSITLNEGVNVIIGHNNAGKTNLLSALSLVVDYQGAKRLGIDDFNKSTSLAELKNNPPSIQITVTISKGVYEEPDDLATIGNWLTKLDSSYEATLTYEYFLPEKEHPDYLKALGAISDTDPKSIDMAWKIIKNDFIRLYIYKIWGGNTISQTVADSESLRRFDFQFLDAIRDVERDMLTGRNTLLKDVFDFFMDYEIKSPLNTTLSKDDKIAEIKRRKSQFSGSADVLIDLLQQRMEEGKKQILSYAKDTGAAFNNAVPNFEGSVSDIDMFSALILIIEHASGIKIPASHNGLGYNNLIYMSLLLAKMQVDSDGDYMGSNSKVFAMLAIEEPEAHLHPALQYKFLKFLKENKNQKKVRQIFVTTHSTHITSAVSLDEIICLHNENGRTTIGYPSLVFPNEQSKKYVQRFLDATKSDMLFAQKVILVEGLAEQLLISILAKYAGKSLEDNHIAVINVGGRYFEHFLHLFDTANPHAIPKKIACLTDRDPVRCLKTDDDYKSCYPFEYHQCRSTYKYKNNASALLFKYRHHSNIRYFSQDSVYGKTFECDLILHNPSLELLVTESVANQDELKNLMALMKDLSKSAEDCLALLPEGSTAKPNKKNLEIKQGLRACQWKDEREKKKAIIASRYLNSIGKGENALELYNALESNYHRKGSSEFMEFYVPNYIKQAIDWICQ